MKNIVKNENGTINITANADIFIVPNSAAKISNYFNPENALTEMNTLCKDNGCQFDPDRDLLIQVWMCSDDLKSDNLDGHGFSFRMDDNRYVVWGRSIPSRIPASMINMKEGETKIINLNNIEAENFLDDSKVSVNLQLTVKASQLDYRYRGFGKFEDAMRCVC